MSEKYGEPWEVKWVDDDLVIYTEDDLVVACIDPTACDGVEVDTENESMPYIDRAVLCVNACANRSDADIKAAFALWDNREKVVEKLNFIRENHTFDPYSDKMLTAALALLQAEKEGKV